MAVQRGDGRLLALIKDTRAGGCCVLMATPHKAAQKLTPKQTLFVAEYLVDHNGKQAAIRAGYAPRSAEMQASRLC